MLESVTGFFLFVSNWIAPASETGKLELIDSFYKKDSTIITVETNYRWVKTATQIVDSGIPLRFNYYVTIDKDQKITFHKKLQFSSVKKSYTVYNSRTKSKSSYSNIFSAVSKLKKTELKVAKRVKKIEFNITVQNIKVKGIEETIDLAPISGGWKFETIIKEDMIRETSK